MTDILLIQPPALKPSEPPLALAVLQAALRPEQTVRSIDANLAAYLYLLDAERLAPLAGPQPSTALRRALRHRQSSLELLRSESAGRSFARYTTAVRYLNQLLSLWGQKSGKERLTLGDYQHSGYSCFAPSDLQRFAAGEAQTLFQRYFAEQLLPQVAAAKPGLIAVSVNYLPQVFPAFELAGLLRRKLPEVTLVAGGGMLSSWQEPLRQLQLRLPPFDRIIFGPGELSLRKLAGGIAGNDYFLEDASEIGFQPDFTAARLGDYLSPEPVLPVSASRGCYWQNCLFCPEAAAPVHPYRGTAASAFPAQLLQLARRHRVANFHLTDNAIPVSILHGLAVRREDLQGISWFGFVRFEKALQDAAFVQQLADSGCRMLQLGLESGSQPVLDRLGKGIQLESAAKILHNLQAAGIAAYVYIMLGTPGETEADAELTLKFLEQHAERIGFLNLSIMNLPRSSGLLDNPQRYGIASSQLQDQNGLLGLYHNFLPSRGWDRAAARRFLEKRLLGSKAIREIVNRTPPTFSSNHAFFFTGKS